MASFLDFLQTPEGMGLLSGVASYAANARKGTPVNNVGRGLLGGLTGYTLTQEEQRRQADDAVNQQYRQMQIDEIKRKQTEQQAAQQWKQGLPGVMDQAKTKVTPFEADDPFNQGAAAFGEVYGGKQHGQQASGAMANVQPGNQQALQEYMMRPESPYANKLLEQQLFPAGDEAFTLSPGQRRFKGGQVVAEVPDTEKIGVGQELREWLTVNGIDPNVATPQQLQTGYKALDDLKRGRAAAGAAQMNNYGTSFTPAVDASGNPVLLQPSKGGGQPNVVQGFMPADDAAKARKAQSAAEKGVSNLDRLADDIKTLKQNKGLPFAVGMYSIAPTIPGSPQADAVAQIENLASRAAVAAINEMREMSTTGGAVGQVTEREWPKLEAQLANLNRKQSYRQFVKSLDAFEKQVAQSKRMIDDARKREPSVSTQPSAGVRKYNPATGRIE